MSSQIKESKAIQGVRCTHCMLSARKFSQPANQVYFTCAHAHKRQAVIKQAGGGIILYQFVHSFSRGDKLTDSISRSALFCSIQC